MLAWKGEETLCGVRPLPPRQAERKLRGVHPLPSRQAEKELRGVPESLVETLVMKVE